jgi:phenylalanyl-tRNA synthetase beta chain
MRVKEALCGLGAYECMHYSFFSPSDLDLLRYPADAPERNAIRIMNPISEELSLMRTTLTASMIHAVVRNQKNGRLDGRLFEIAKVFVPKALPLTEYPDERDHLVVAFWGKGEDFFTVKGAAETVADTLHVKFAYKAATRSFTHPYQTADVICEGQTVGYIGTLAYDIAEGESMRTNLYLMELDLAALYPLCGNTPAFEPLPKFLDVSRDLALVMDKNITCAQVEDQIRAACKYVTDIKLFDIYEGMPIPPTMKSMAFTVTFRQGEEEFTAEDLDRFVAKILRKLDAVLGITLRT